MHEASGKCGVAVLRAHREEATPRRPRVTATGDLHLETAASDDYHWGDRWEELVTKYVRREGTKDKMYFPPSQEYLEDIAQIFTLSEFLQDIRKVQLQKKDYADMKVNKDFLRKYVKALKATETERQDRKAPKMSKSPKQLWYSDHKPQKHRAPTYRGALPQTAIEDVKLLDVPALPVVVRGMAESPPVREVVPLLTSSPTPFTPHIRIEEVQSIELKAIEPKTPCRRPGRSARESAIILGSLPRIPLTKTFTEDLLAELKSDGPQRAGTGGDCRKPSDSPRKPSGREPLPFLGNCSYNDRFCLQLNSPLLYTTRVFTNASNGGRGAISKYRVNCAVKRGAELVLHPAGARGCAEEARARRWIRGRHREAC
ncbi:hypothetical protein HBH98_241990 [Parastagonospora nodorum]|nr:hypothetical protein HBH53_246830 [Parastagonospora nodorum]KAH3956600.1 hypothetical protein HBH51_239120 [Parastagonospora nodorum]KAH4215602.1 hypothetical protein HBI06_245720 [Parastagonospora nodorum]KAH4224335.1 hypothetical protein HBI05_238770 [Parastagonospora nodorum]KAH4334405.1 hypothetical protein HBH98_241990 [Parastagonospora nodorum]